MLKLDPYSADLAYGTSILYFLKGNTFAAQAYLQKFVDLAPNAVITRHLREIGEQNEHH